MYVCLDIETTGLDPKNDHVIEVAIVVFDNEKIIREWSSLVKAPVGVPEFVERLTGINNEMLKDAPILSDVADEIREFVGDMPIMGHFIFFDLNFLGEKGIRLTNTQLDTCQLAQTFMHNEASYSLEVLTEKFGISHENAHRALDDVKANIDFFWRMGSHIAALSKEEKSAIQEVLEKSKWPWAKVILELSEKSTGELIKTEEAKKSSAHFEKHIDLNKESLEPPFLLQELTHTDQDLVDYASSLEEKTLLVLPELHDFGNEIGILKDPSNYLDLQRFESFINKETLNQPETMLAAKIKLWSLKTKTGEKSEIRLVKEENDLWYDICCPNNGEPTSFYKEALDRASEKKVSIISHYHFLREKSKSENNFRIPANLVVGQVEQFVDQIEDSWHIIMSEKRFTSDIRRLKFENPKNEDLIEHLASRISIMFGLIGITIEKFGDEDDKRHTLIVDPEHRSSPEWNKVKESATSVESTLEAFDASLANTPARKSFEKYLTYLTGVLKNSKHMLWMNLDMEEQPVIHIFPADTRKIFREFIWKDVEKLHLFSHNGNFEFIKDELALPEDIKNKKVESLRGLPIFYADRKISNPNSDTNITEVSREVKEQLEGREGNFFLLVTSMRNAEKFFYALKTERKLFVQNMSGGLGKIAKMSEKTDGNNLFVGNEEMFDNLLREGKIIKFLAIHRLPFSYPSDPIQMSRAKYYENEFEDYSIPKCALRLQGVLDKFLGNEWQDKKVFIYDQRIDDYKLLN